MNPHWNRIRQGGRIAAHLQRLIYRKPLHAWMYFGSSDDRVEFRVEPRFNWMRDSPSLGLWARRVMDGKRLKRYHLRRDVRTFGILLNARGEEVQRR